MELLIYFMAVYATSWIVVEATIFHEIREWIFAEEATNILQLKIQQLISCIYCTSFWAGLIIFSGYSNLHWKLVPIYALAGTTFTFFIERMLYVKEEHHDPS
jgi:hypothetical protein